MSISSRKIPVNVWNKMSLEDRWCVLVNDEQGPFDDEADLHNAFCRVLGGLGIPFQHERMDKRTRGTVGWTDFTIVLPNGVTWYLEVKSPLKADPFKHLSDEQVYMGLALDHLGHDWMVLNSWEEMILGLKIRLFPEIPASNQLPSAMDATKDLPEKEFYIAVQEPSREILSALPTDAALKHIDSWRDIYETQRNIWFGITKAKTVAICSTWNGPLGRFDELKKKEAVNA